MGADVSLMIAAGVGTAAVLSPDGKLLVFIQSFFDELRRVAPPAATR